MEIMLVFKHIIFFARIAYIYQMIRDFPAIYLIIR